MTSPSTLLRLSPAVPHVRQSFSISSFSISDSSIVLSNVWSNDTPANVSLLRLRCNAISKPHAQVVLDNGIPIVKWGEIIEQGDKKGKALKVSELNEVEKRINTIKAMLGSMEDGEISSSAYDTAWVALVKDIQGSGAPQFPSSLQWIVENQLLDGSWGDLFMFSAHDRIINTLACVIALKSWNIYPERCEKGMDFIRENMSKLGDENIEHMPIGFEVAFPSLIEIAQKIDLEVPEDSPILQDIYAKRNVKLTRIPKDMMHIVPTTLLHSLEGMSDLDWERLLNLQCLDGSFLFSPSSTAFALMQTKDEKCLEYLKKAVNKFNGGVPNVYPVDLFEHIWAVDRLERLGISRYFQSEIKECLNYVYRYWTEDGICWARNSRVQDIDDTAMGFRLLRLHGHEVSADVFQHFEKGGEFFCFSGQSNQAVTGIFNLYRASQVLFPQENILEEAKTFSYKFLREKESSKKLLDKWIITKDLPGEVGYALDVPWYASLPRIETRFYVEQYGGEDDVWIGKTLYRMPYVNNNIYLELAKLDFNNCQAIHQIEWVNIQKWYTEYNLREFGISRKTVLQTYFIAMASIFEPERSLERLAWTQTAVLIEAISSHFEEANLIEQRRAFIDDFINSTTRDEIKINNNTRLSKSSWKTTGERLVLALLGTLNHLSLNALLAHGRDVRHHFQRSWETWLLTWQSEEEEEDKEAEHLVRTITLCAGRSHSEELLSHPHYEKLVNLINRICHHLRRTHNSKEVRKKKINGKKMKRMASLSVESDMQELVQCVLQSSDGTNIDCEIKKMFLIVAKSFFYTAYCTPTMINFHIIKVLFERVV